MATRLRSAFLALVLLIVLSACSAGESSSKALEEGVIPVDQFHSEDGTFQYARLPIGVTREEAAKRLGVEDLGAPVAGMGDVATYSPANRPTFEGQEAAVLLEFQGDGLTLIKFNFLSHEKETLVPIYEELTQRLYELYGIYSRSQNEQPPVYSESYYWDTHLDGSLTRLALIYSWAEQEDGSTAANLSLAVGKMVYANETD